MLRINGCSGQDTRRGRRRRTRPHGASRDGTAATMAAAGSGFVRHKALQPRTSGKSRIIGRQKLWLATMMPGAASMGRPVQRFIGNAERTTITHACRSPFARPSSLPFVAVGWVDNKFFAAMVRPFAAEVQSTKEPESDVGALDTVVTRRDLHGLNALFGQSR
jgi:hypothetical protein